MIDWDKRYKEIEDTVEDDFYAFTIIEQEQNMIEQEIQEFAKEMIDESYDPDYMESVANKLLKDRGIDEI